MSQFHFASRCFQVPKILPSSLTKVTLKSPFRHFRKKVTLKPLSGPATGLPRAFYACRQCWEWCCGQSAFFAQTIQNNMSGLILAHFRPAPRPVDFRVGRWVCEGSGSKRQAGQQWCNHRRQPRLQQVQAPTVGKPPAPSRARTAGSRTNPGRF